MPSLRQNVGGVWKIITPWVKVGSVWKLPNFLHNVGGVWKTIAASLSATASPDISETATGVNYTTSGSMTATPIGGTAPYTYSWTQTSGDAMTITSPSAQSTTFSVTGMTIGTTKTGTFSCSVTDANSFVVMTNERTVSISR